MLGVLYNFPQIFPSYSGIPHGKYLILGPGFMLIRGTRLHVLCFCYVQALRLGFGVKVFRVLRYLGKLPHLAFP